MYAQNYHPSCRRIGTSIVKKKRGATVIVAIFVASASTSVVSSFAAGIGLVDGMLPTVHMGIRHGMGFKIFQRQCSTSTNMGVIKTMADGSKNLWSVQDCLEQWNSLYSSNITESSTVVGKHIQFVDATWFHKGDRNGRREFEAGPRLPGAFHWDIADLATTKELFPEDNPKDLKNVFPPEWLVGAALERMEVVPDIANNSATDTNSSTTLVVYGREGTRFAPRVWYMLRKYYRGGSVRLLQGSLEEWIRQGGPVDSTKKSRSEIQAKDLFLVESDDDNGFRRLHPWISSKARNRLVDMEFVLEFLNGKQTKTQQQRGSQMDELVFSSDNDTISPTRPSVIIDTRGSSFAKKGHIPGAIHIPYASLSLPEDPTTLKSKDELIQILKNALGETLFDRLREQPPLLSCGTGVSVCTLALVLEELDFPEPWIYDGSWNEWGQDPTTPKAGVDNDVEND
uniref:Rhodanese domain-containing protein n=1 Tax=Pseudo-nitzschia australis TaxID=44445 RepID=A0A7S4AR50_9STRA|mmetsp:Transcript_25719/g.56401  ORF Transcript_25719/g.56401 Transcript_25719/m.56401 type:complete len:455 (+) Transcript_25719:135-1499(+)